MKKINSMFMGFIILSLLNIMEHQTFFLMAVKKHAWNVEKKDHDINHSLMNSLFYRHLFDQTKGHELTADLGIYNLRGENSSTLLNEETGYFHQNSTMPAHTVGNLKLDYSLPLSNLFKLEAGLQTRLQQMHDKGNADFNYGENTFAGYGLLSYQGKKLHLQAGFRLEKSELGQQKNILNSTFLPCCLMRP
jgi:hypothetical protein